MITSLYKLGRDAQTYYNLLYLLTALPLGICYIVLLLCCLASSLAIVTIPLLIILLILCWRLAIFERWLTCEWLHIAVPPMAKPLPADSNLMQRCLLHLRRPVAWKSLLYLFLKGIFGLVAFEFALIVPILIFVLALVGTIIGLIVAPFFFLIWSLCGREATGKSIKNYFFLWGTAYGILLTPLYVTNGLAYLWGHFSRVMLGLSQTHLRLEQARALAERERARAEGAFRGARRWWR